MTSKSKKKSSGATDAANANEAAAPMALLDLYTDPAQNIVQQLDVGLIVESPTNARQKYDEEKLQELADSIRAVGIMQAVLVRPTTLAGVDGYELVFGHRRRRAALLAELRTMPAIVRELTDAQASQLQALENIQREDLDPIDEAEGYRRYMEAHGVSAKQLGDVLKKSRTYVYNQLKLIDLCDRGKDLVRRAILDTETAVQVARLATKELQEDLLEHIVVVEAGGENEGASGIERVRASHREVVRIIDVEYSRHLDKARFNKQDMFLVADRADCSSCPQRAGNIEGLNATGKRADICTNVACFDKKTEAHVAQVVADQEAKGGTVISGAEATKYLGWDGQGLAYGQATYLQSDIGDHRLNGKTPQELLGKKLKPADIVRIVTPEGSVIEAVARATLVKHGFLEAPSQRGGDEYVDDLQQQQAEWRRKHQEEDLRRAGRRKVFDVLVELLKGVGRRADDMLAMAWSLWMQAADCTDEEDFSMWVARHDEGIAQLWKEEEYDDVDVARKKATYAWLSELESDHLARICIELSLFDLVDRVPAAGAPDPLEALAALYGVDVPKQMAMAAAEEAQREDAEVEA